MPRFDLSTPIHASIPGGRAWEEFSVWILTFLPRHFTALSCQGKQLAWRHPGLISTARGRRGEGWASSRRRGPAGFACPDPESGTDPPSAAWSSHVPLESLMVIAED